MGVLKDRVRLAFSKLSDGDVEGFIHGLQIAYPRGYHWQQRIVIREFEEQLSMMEVKRNESKNRISLQILWKGKSRETLLQHKSQNKLLSEEKGGSDKRNGPK